jgi:hypothetical protein
VRGRRHGRGRALRGRRLSGVRPPGRRRARAAAPALLAALVLLGGPLLLHVAHRRHAVLPLDLEARFPAERPLVGGEVFATTLAELIDHELRGGTGWRPNDFFLWGPRLWADNNANRQLGILLAVRESVRVFKDHLTKVSSDEFDPALVAADTALRNDALRFWLPSAERRYGEGVAHLRAYAAGLGETPPRSRPLNRRNVEMIRLFQAWSDLLGDAHGVLYRSPRSPWLTDDDFYHAQGVAHALVHLVRAVAREYRDDLAPRPVLRTLFAQVETALGRAAVLKPLVVLDGGPSGVFANHRRNLDTFVVEARQKMYSIREELEK